MSTRNIKLVGILICSFFSNIIFAQQILNSNDSNTSAIANANTTIKEKDLVDLIKTIFKIKNKIEKPEKIKKVYFTLFPVAGYTLQTGFAAAVSCGAAFYTDTSKNKKLSTINSSITYTQYNQFLFPLTTNIWLKKNNYILIIDDRFLKYPSTTYGIGAKTTENDAYTLNYNYIKLHQTILRKIYSNLYGGVGFYYDHLWNIKEVEPPIGIKTSFQKYGAAEKETAAAIILKLLLDTRDNQINAKNGTLASIIFRPNYTFLGSDKNWKSLQLEYRKYFKLSATSKNILALWSYNWLTLGKGKVPYLLLPSTSWDDQYNTGRGYVQGRYRAKNMIYAEAEYRFSLTSNGLLGAVVFANAQSFSKNISNQLSVLAPGYGAGLRIKFNKNSNTNLCIDYGFGINGSKGIFLNLGEVF